VQTFHEEKVSQHCLHLPCSAKFRLLVHADDDTCMESIFFPVNALAKAGTDQVDVSIS
jgi:hypothetical protein